MRAILLLACLLSACDTEEAASPPAAPPVCRLEKLADLPMVPGTPWAIVPAKLNGHPVSMMLDTGAERLTVLPRAKHDLGLAEDKTHRTVVRGIGGTVTNYDVLVDQLQLGDTQLFTSGAAVAELRGMPPADPPVAGVIGADVMSEYDMELNFRQRRVGLWQRSGCDTIAPAWQGAWSTVRLVPGQRNLVTLNVQVDGHPVRAMLDTGAATTTISIEAAGQVGITAAELAAAHVSNVRGADDTDVITHVSAGHEIAAGDARSKPFALIVGPVHVPFADMLLGADFFGQRDVWISYTGRKIFIQ